MLAGGIMDKTGMEAIKMECQGRIEEALNFADQSPYPLPAEALEDVWA